MFKRLPVASLTLGELISNRAIFHVPPFQRPYVWEIDQALQLLDDMTSAAGLDASDLSEPDYFFGTVLLLTEPSAGLPGGLVTGGQPQTYHIIDGQQRLTTLTILAAVLRDLAAEAGERSDRLAAIIALPSAGLGESAPLDFAPYHIVLSGRERSFFMRNVQKPGSCRNGAEGGDPETEASRRIIEVRDAFIGALVQLDANQRRRLSEYLVESCHFVVTLSHDIDRAHRLFTVLNERGKPLQRNDILKVEVLSAFAGDETEPVRKWEEAEQLIGSQFEHFFSHLKAVYGRTETRIVAAVRNLVVDAGGPAEFLDNVLLPYAHIFAGMTTASRSPNVAGAPYAPSLLYLARLRGTEWVPAVMLTLKKYESKPEVARSLIEAIDRTSHLLRVMCQGSGRRITRFHNIVRAIDSGAAVSADAEVFRFTREELAGAVYNLRDLHNRNQQISKVLLMRINDVIEGRVRPLDPADYSVEHVLPVRPQATSVWRDLIPDPEIRDLATQSLGNLTLLPGRLNEKVRNRDFKNKRDLLEAGLTKESSMAIVLDVVEANTWDLATIRAREKVMLNAAAKILGVDPGDATLPADQAKGQSRAT